MVLCNPVRGRVQLIALRELNSVQVRTTLGVFWSNVHSCYNSNMVDVPGRKYVFGPTQAHFSPRLRLELK